MFPYFRLSLPDAAAAIIGRALIAFVFVGAAAVHLTPPGWNETIVDMQNHGVSSPQLLLAVAMAISIAASVALLVGFKSRWTAYTLAGYTLIVSWVMHNPVHAAGVQLFLYIKDLGIAGALMALAANSRDAR